MPKARLVPVLLALLLGVGAGCNSCPLCKGHTSEKSSAGTCASGSCSACKSCPASTGQTAEKASAGTCANGTCSLPQ